MARTTPRFPNFLVIGAAKSGTYTLHTHFDRHPQIYMCPVKEPHFFSFGNEKLVPGGTHLSRPVHKRINSVDDYLRLFTRADGALMAGECSVSYLYWPGSAERIHRFSPRMKLIVSLREPIERAYSSFNYARSYGMESLPALSEGFAAEKERIRNNASLLLRYRDLGLYAAQLERYFALFPASQIQVILYEDLVARPSLTLRMLYEFLGVDKEVVSQPDLHVNPTRVPNRNNPLHRLISSENGARSTVRRILPLSARERLRHLAIRSLFERPPAMDPGERLEFQGLFREDIQRLEGLIGRDLSAWL